MGIFVTKEEKETQKLQRQKFLAAQKLRDEKVRTEEILKNEKYTEQLTEKELEKATLSNLSDRDIQVQMLKAIKSTNGWIIFIGVVTLVNVIGAIIIAISLLN
tara:strand:- start:1275 stop:1583 length:309 start_codon:yes stop_codon:yes gene_type:complete